MTEKSQKHSLTIYLKQTKNWNVKIYVTVLLNSNGKNCINLNVNCVQTTDWRTVQLYRAKILNV